MMLSLQPWAIAPLSLMTAAGAANITFAVDRYRRDRPWTWFALLGVMFLAADVCAFLD
jgi:hypothetical protein